MINMMRTGGRPHNVCYCGRAVAAEHGAQKQRKRRTRQTASNGQHIMSLGMTNLISICISDDVLRMMMVDYLSCMYGMNIPHPRNARHNWEYI